MKTLLLLGVLLASAHSVIYNSADSEGRPFCPVKFPMGPFFSRFGGGWANRLNWTAILEKSAPKSSRNLMSILETRQPRAQEELVNYMDENDSESARQWFAKNNRRINCNPLCQKLLSLVRTNQPILKSSRDFMRFLGTPRNFAEPDNYLDENNSMSPGEARQFFGFLETIANTVGTIAELFIGVNPIRVADKIIGVIQKP